MAASSETGRPQPPAQRADGNGDTPTASDPLNLGEIAVLFQRWPGPTLMAVGTALTLAASGLRAVGSEIAGVS